MVILPIDFQRKLAKYLVIALVLLQTAMLLSVYLVSGLMGKLTLPKIYISNAFRADPARAIAAFILPLCAFISFILVGQRCLFLYDLLRNPADKRLFWATVVLMSAASLGMCAVAAVSIDTMKILHWLAAGVLFCSSSVMMCIVTVLEHRLSIAQPVWLHRFRIATVVLSFIATIVLVGTSKHEPLAASVSEMVLATLLLIWFTTLAHGSSFPLVSVKEPKSPRPAAEPLIKDDL